MRRHSGAYERALTISPTNPDLWAFTAITLKGGLQRDDPARAAWKRAQELDPDIREAFSHESEEMSQTVERKISGSCRGTLRRLMEEERPDSP